jgi:hypothetical protein
MRCSRALPEARRAWKAAAKEGGSEGRRQRRKAAAKGDGSEGTRQRRETAAKEGGREGRRPRREATAKGGDGEGRRGCTVVAVERVQQLRDKLVRGDEVEATHGGDEVA